MNSQAVATRGRLALVTAGFVLSGVAGLVFEVLWGRYLGLFVGGTAEAHTLVLATFMGGLALGNALFGRLVDRVPNRLWLYAALEAGVGLFCFFFPEIFEAVGEVWLQIARATADTPGLRGPLKMALAAICLLPPTILMGGTLPALARAITDRLEDAGAQVARLYFVNSLGAAAGAALAGFWMLEAVGLELGMRLGASLNLLLALAFALAGRGGGALALRRMVDGRQADQGTASPAPPTAPGADAASQPGADAVPGPGAPIDPAARRALMALIVIGVSGGVTMVYELAWVRMLSLVLGSSTWSFGLMLTVFITGIALGSAIAERLLRRSVDPVRAFALAEAGVFAAVLLMLPLYNLLPWAFHLVATRLPRTPETFGLWLWLKVAVAGGLMLGPTLFIGATLPFATAACVDDLSRMGRKVGAVFSVNTAGTIAGAALTGLVILPTWGLSGALYTGVAASGICAVVLLWSDRRVWPGRARGAILVSIPALYLLAVFALPPLDVATLNRGIYRRRTPIAATWAEAQQRLAPMKLIFQADGSNASIAVFRDARSGHRYLKSNGKTEASSELDMSTQYWLGHLGLLLFPGQEPRRVAHIGLASGVSAAATLRWPGVTLDLVEIEAAMVQAAALFSDINDRVLVHPRLKLHLMDAREFFQLSAPETYDVIVSEPSNPWVAGIGNLYTRRFFETLRSRLSSRGLMVQWLHTYEMDDSIAAMVVQTYCSVFPHVSVWRSGPTDVLLVGSKQPLHVDRAQLEARLARPELQVHLRNARVGMNVRDALDVLALQVLSERRTRQHFPGQEPLNRDDRPLLELWAPKAFFVGRETDLFLRLDERRLVPSRGRTALAAAMRQGVSAARIDDLVGMDTPGRGGRETSVDRVLRLSVQEAALAQAATPTASEAQRSRASAAERRLRAARDPAGLRRAADNRARHRDGALVGEALFKAARFEALRLRRLACVYHVPDGEFLATLLADALQSEAPPQPKARLLATAARTWWALGDRQRLDAAIGDLHRLIGAGGEALAAMQVTDPWKRLPETGRGRLDVLIAWLEAQRALDADRPEQAEEAARRVLTRDPGHVGATALLWRPGSP